MFSPNGSLSRLYKGSGSDNPIEAGGGTFPTATVYLMIGKLKTLGSENLKQGENLWISIGHLSGAITVAKMYADAEGLKGSRALARAQRSAGG
jgi:hypothetical protein